MSAIFKLRVLALALACIAMDGAENKAAAPTTAHEGGAHYAHLFGQTYRTKVDLYLFTLYNDPDTIYLGRNDGTPTSRLPDLPRAIEAANLGRTFGKATILGVVTAGTPFVLTAETHEVTAQSGIPTQGGYPLGFICTLIGEVQPTVGVLCEFIQHAEKAPPNTPNQTIDETIATNLSR